MDGTEELEVMNGDDDNDGDYCGRMKNYDDVVVLCALKKSKKRWLSPEQFAFLFTGDTIYSGGSLGDVAA
jgi:hypothetical protein